MRFLSRIRLRLHLPALFLLVLSSLLCVPIAILHGADDSSESELGAQIWQYISTEDGDEARALLGSILQRPDATVQALEVLLRKGPPHSLQPVGLLPDEQVVVRDRTYRYSLSVPERYEPNRDYALVVCLHGAGFTGEAYLDRWKTRLG